MSMEIISREENKITAKCPFCRGKGIDPFELLSKFSVCQVCNGRGKITIQEPAVECAFCSGSGVYRDQRLTCTVCGGKGMVTIKEPTETCPACNGRGVVEGGYLPCLKCGGKGVITKKIDGEQWSVTTE